MGVRQDGLSGVRLGSLCDLGDLCPSRGCPPLCQEPPSDWDTLSPTTVVTLTGTMTVTLTVNECLLS